MKAGELARNFVRARIIALGAVLDALARAELPVATCLEISIVLPLRAEVARRPLGIVFADYKIGKSQGTFMSWGKMFISAVLAEGFV